MYRHSDTGYAFSLGDLVFWPGQQQLTRVFGLRSPTACLFYPEVAPPLLDDKKLSNTIPMFLRQFRRYCKHDRGSLQRPFVVTGTRHTSVWKVLWNPSDLLMAILIMSLVKYMSLSECNCMQFPLFLSQPTRSPRFCSPP